MSAIKAFVKTSGIGGVAVFVPTGPNPTSGLIFHVPRDHVHPVAVSVEEAMRSVIGCGAGSTALVNGLESGGNRPMMWIRSPD